MIKVAIVLLDHNYGIHCDQLSQVDRGPLALWNDQYVVGSNHNSIMLQGPPVQLLGVALISILLQRPYFSNLVV